MRELRFRAWDKEQKKMLDVSMAGNRNFMVGNPWKFMDDGSDTTLYLHTEKYILMQYTNLKDRKGTEIYEGDIVKHRGFGDHPFYTTSIEWEDAGWVNRYHDTWETGELHSSTVTDCEVIGNIYENGDLLKEDHESR